MPANLWDLADLCTPWCLHVAATLGIARHISEGVHEIHALAHAAHCDPHVLHAILTQLANKGVFLQPTPGRFELNEAGRELLNPAMLLCLDLEGIGGRMAHAWSTLLTFARTGQPAYDQVFGLPFFQDLAAHPHIAESFDAMIGPMGHGTPDPHFDLTLPWDQIRTVTDVGGGTGAMLAEILRAHPHLRGTLVDVPATVARSAPNFSADLTPRLTLAAQSFFDPLPKGSDVYLLRGILNDWPDREALAILSRCAEAARPAGRVVVLKSISPDGTPPSLTIEMVLVGGRKRTVTEFRELARQAGLEVKKAGQQPAYFVVECSAASDA